MRAHEPTKLPTTPCSVVWSGGHCYVLEGYVLGGTGQFGARRWVGLDDYGRPLALRPEQLQARGWTFTPG